MDKATGLLPTGMSGFLLLLVVVGVVAVLTSARGTKRTSRDVRSLVAIGGKADMAVTSADFRV